MYKSVVIIGTGRYEPTVVVENNRFLKNIFYNQDGVLIEKSNEEIIQKFEEITNIKRRKYVTPELVTSDIAAFAANDALVSSRVNPETLSEIIIAHNFGDVKYGYTQSDFVPSLGSRVKQKLGIANPKTVAKDIIFGCPGWLEGMIDAHLYIKDKVGKKAMVIGAETLSRISDPYDVDSMIYADGAGAAIIETIESEEKVGIISHNTHTYALEEANLLSRGRSYNPRLKIDDLFLKMDGHAVYNFALSKVPEVVQEDLDSAGIQPEEVKKIIIHQANQKMDEKILQRIRRAYKGHTFRENIMPMIIEDYGNSSVATIPTLFDLLVKGKMPCHDLKKGDIILLTSIGAGMNINNMIYKMHQDLADYRN